MIQLRQQQGQRSRIIRIELEQRKLRPHQIRDPLINRLLPQHRLALEQNPQHLQEQPDLQHRHKLIILQNRPLNKPKAILQIHKHLRKTAPTNPYIEQETEQRNRAPWQPYPARCSFTLLPLLAGLFTATASLQLLQRPEIKSNNLLIENLQRGTPVPRTRPNLVD